MTKTQREQIVKLQENQFANGGGVSTRQKVFDELSERQTMYCCCGKLATGLHERNCKKFNDKVDIETLKHLTNH